MPNRRHEVSAGGIVVRDGPTGRQALLIQTPRGVWSFPKGHVEPGEAQDKAAEREVLEETGVQARVAKRTGSIRYYFYDRGTLVDKVVHWFLMYWQSGEPIGDGLETLDARFFAEHKVQDALKYHNEHTAWLEAVAAMDGL